VPGERDSAEPSAVSPSSLIAAVFKALEKAELPVDPSWSPEEVGFVAAVREAILAAGTTRVERELNPHGWLQLGVRAPSEQAVADFLVNDLAEAARGWQSGGQIDRFFFMRKPPGLRIRFRGRNLRQRILPNLLERLERAREEGRVTGHEFGVYDAETHQFGGALGLDIAHEWFTADSFAAIALLALEHSGRDTSGREALSLFALNDLISRVAGDSWEQWDVWSELRLTGRLPRLSTTTRAELLEELEKNREGLSRSLWKREVVLASLSVEEQAIANQLCAANSVTAARLKRAAAQGALEYGPRKILPFFIIFHWNRLGFEVPLQMALAFFMEQLLNPKGNA
jgi:thiopeptide-type bacteriocin biosynthesis protein